MSKSPKTAADVQAYIDTHHIQAEMLLLAEATPTVPEAARVLGTTPKQVIKSLIFLVDGEPILVIANGTSKVDRRKIARHFAVGHKKVKFASTEQALEITGYVVGSMPPFGHQRRLATYIDRQIMDLSVVFGGGGDMHAMIKLTPDELRTSCQGQVLDVME
jgi:Cys-tRNA(Pro) deacylase